MPRCRDVAMLYGEVEVGKRSSSLRGCAQTLIDGPPMTAR
jgi:hypothetical protein